MVTNQSNMVHRTQAQHMANRTQPVQMLNRPHQQVHYFRQPDGTLVQIQKPQNYHPFGGNPTLGAYLRGNPQMKREQVMPMVPVHPPKVCKKLYVVYLFKLLPIIHIHLVENLVKI